MEIIIKRAWSFGWRVQDSRLFGKGEDKYSNMVRNITIRTKKYKKT